MTTPTSSFLDSINGEFEQTFIVAAGAAFQMGATEDSLIAAKRVFAYNPNSKLMLQFFPQFTQAIQKISKLVEQHGAQLESNSSDYQLWTTLGFCYLTIGDFPNAFAAFAHALRVFPESTNPTFWYAMGIVYAHYNYLEKAVNFFNKALKLDPAFPFTSDINFRIALIKRTLGSFDLALTYLEKVRSNPPSGLASEDIVFQIAYTHQLAGHTESALNSYRELYTRHPESLKLSQQLAWFLFTLSNPASPNLGSNLSNNSGPSNLGGNRFGATTEEVELIVSRAFTYHPHDPVLTLIAARLAMRHDDMATAYQHYRFCISYCSDSPYFWCSLGLLYYKNDQTQDAVVAFQRALYLQSEMPEAWLNIGLIFEQQSDFNSALKIYETGQQRCNGYPEFEVRISALNMQRVGHRKIGVNYQLIEIDDSKFITPTPEEFATSYKAAVPELPVECYGIGDDAAEFKMFSTYPKSYFISK